MSQMEMEDLFDELVRAVHELNTCLQTDHDKGKLRISEKTSNAAACVRRVMGKIGPSSPYKKALSDVAKMDIKGDA